MAVLMDKAANFLSKHADYERFGFPNYITIDETPKFFQDIYTQNGGKMPPALKNDYGNPNNPINGRLLGLLFSARFVFSTGEPYGDSQFGPRRLKLPVTHLLTRNKHLYFADFYCMVPGPMTSERHHVTLVLCEPGSVSDAFCASVLPQLNIAGNPFLYINVYQNGTASVHATKGAYVEIFYTEDMDISNMTQCFEDVDLGLDRLHSHIPRKMAHAFTATYLRKWNKSKNQQCFKLSYCLE